MPLHIVYQPRLVVKPILKMVDDNGQHVVVWRDDAKIRAVLRLLEADKLLHPQLFMQHTTGDVRYSKHICISEIPRYIALTEHLTYILEQRRVQSAKFREISP